MCVKVCLLQPALGFRGAASQRSRSRVLAGGAPARGGESAAVGARERQPGPCSVLEEG